LGGRRTGIRRATTQGFLVAAAVLLGSATVLVTGTPAPATAPVVGWSADQATLPTSPNVSGANPAPAVTAVSCASSVFCLAVGSYSDAAGQQGLIETLSLGNWSPVEAPLPTDASVDPRPVLRAVSCPAVGWCEVVGSYVDRSLQTRGFIDTLAGGAWTARQAPTPADGGTAGSNLESVSCPAAGSCLAVGSDEQGDGGVFGLVDALSNGAWSAAQGPQPAGAAMEQDVELTGVSCPEVGPCAATGYYYSAALASQMFVLQQAVGGMWEALDAPLPADAGSGGNEYSVPSALSCGGDICEATGQYSDTAGKSQGLLERFAGGIWTPTPAALPVGTARPARQVDVTDISCVFDGCVAVGDYTDGAGHQRGLVETIVSGLAFASQAPAADDASTGGGPGTSLTAISCVSVARCAAGGWYESTGGHRAGLLESELGADWYAQSAPGPTAVAAQVSAVSCTDGGACVAGGDGGRSASTDGLLQTFTPSQGYWAAASDGGVFAFGDATFHGSSGGTPLNEVVVGMAATPGGSGYWEVASDGGVFAYGDAQFYGSAGGLHLSAPIVGMASTPDGLGYWLVAADGWVFAYGDAQFFGSAGGLPLRAPVVGMASTPDGRGYWLVASDGGIFAFGDAAFPGSGGTRPHNAPIVGIAATPSGLGYWEVAADGGVFAFGDARFYGSAAATHPTAPVVALLPSFDGGGYWLVGSDGGVFSFGDAGFVGSAGGLRLNSPVVGGAAG
jgi:hypothetical protein